ncbi:NAD(P)-binding domain-containing protein [Azospirillum baldaniorum]|nr:NAD(P)-binding domain-containing protein [Azospirillum baldaniorum]
MADLKDRAVGFIGLGLMGRPMARNLAKAGAALVISSRSPGPVEELAGEGMSPAAGPAEVAARADAIVLMLSDTVAVEAVAAALMDALRPGHLVIDMGTTAVGATRKLAEAGPRQGRRLGRRPGVGRHGGGGGRHSDHHGRRHGGGLRPRSAAVPGDGPAHHPCR